jgi:hypothetical protein
MLGGAMSNKVHIFDTTLRDGEQSPGCSMNLDEKLQMARQLDRLGVDILEAGFPIASQGDFDAVKAIAAEIRRPVVAALARASEQDSERAWEALQGAARPRIHTFLATSDIHLQFKLHKTNGEYPVADSNDPIKGCDPLGFPRNMLFMTRGIVFTTMPGKMIEMSEYNRIWREIWTDGRELPKDVGGRSADAPDPRWYGYSVGHWEGDYTFVVNTVGSDPRTWLDNAGHPHSVDLRVEERYTR